MLYSITRPLYVNKPNNAIYVCSLFTEYSPQNSIVYMGRWTITDRDTFCGMKGNVNPCGTDIVIPLGLSTYLNPGDWLLLDLPW